MKPLGQRDRPFSHVLALTQPLGGRLPLGISTDVIARTFPVLQLSLEESDRLAQSPDFDNEWDFFSNPLLGEDKGELSPEETSSVTSHYAPQTQQSFAEPNPSENPSTELDVSPKAEITEILSPSITRNPLGPLTPLGNRPFLIDISDEPLLATSSDSSALLDVQAIQSPTDQSEAQSVTPSVDRRVVEPSETELAQTFQAESSASDPQIGQWQTNIVSSEITSSGKQAVIAESHDQPDAVQLSETSATSISEAVEATYSSTNIVSQPAFTDDNDQTVHDTVQPSSEVSELDIRDGTEKTAHSTTDLTFQNEAAIQREPLVEVEPGEITAFNRTSDMPIQAEASSTAEFDTQGQTVSRPETAIAQSLSAELADVHTQLEQLQTNIISPEITSSPENQDLITESQDHTDPVQLSETFTTSSEAVEATNSPTSLISQPTSADENLQTVRNPAQTSSEISELERRDGTEETSHTVTDISFQAESAIQRKPLAKVESAEIKAFNQTSDIPIQAEASSTTEFDAQGQTVLQPETAISQPLSAESAATQTQLEQLQPNIVSPKITSSPEEQAAIAERPDHSDIVQLSETSATSISEAVEATNSLTNLVSQPTSVDGNVQTVCDTVQPSFEISELEIEDGTEETSDSITDLASQAESAIQRKLLVEVEPGEITGIDQRPDIPIQTEQSVISTINEPPLSVSEPAAAQTLLTESSTPEIQLEQPQTRVEIPSALEQSHVSEGIALPHATIHQQAIAEVLPEPSSPAPSPQIRFEESESSLQSRPETSPEAVQSHLLQADFEQSEVNDAIDTSRSSCPHLAPLPSNISETIPGDFSTVSETSLPKPLSIQRQGEAVEAIVSATALQEEPDTSLSLTEKAPYQGLPPLGQTQPLGIAPEFNSPLLDFSDQERLVESPPGEEASTRSTPDISLKPFDSKPVPPVKQTPLATQPISDSWSSIDELLQQNPAQLTEERSWQDVAASLNFISQAPTIEQFQDLEETASSTDVFSTDLSEVIQPLVTLEQPFVEEVLITPPSGIAGHTSESKEEKLEQLAWKIYHQLRQRFAIEFERRGQSPTNFPPWSTTIALNSVKTFQTASNLDHQMTTNIIEMLSPIDTKMAQLTAAVYYQVRSRLEIEQERYRVRSDRQF